MSWNISSEMAAWYGPTVPELPPEERAGGRDAAPMLDAEAPRRGSGLLIGRFCPPHLGHQSLIDFARGWCAHLTVLVYASEMDAIPLPQRVAWLAEMAPGARIIPVGESVTPVQRDEPAFWSAWVAIVRKHVHDGPHWLFSSRSDAAPLAEALGARFACVDSLRSATPVTSSEILADPLARWRYVPAPVRPHFVRRVCVAGVPSGAKTSLVRRLAQRHGTVMVPGCVTAVAACRSQSLRPSDIAMLARGQTASEDAMARQAERVLFCDGDLTSIRITSERLFGTSPSWMAQEDRARRYALHLVLDATGASADDVALTRALMSELGRLGRRQVLLSGSDGERFAQACVAVDELLTVRGAMALA